MDDKKDAKVFIKNIEGLGKSNIDFHPAPHSFSVSILGEKNLKLTIDPLYKKIVPSSSKYIISGTTLKIILRKSKETTWTKLKKSSLDKKNKEEKKEDKEKSKEDPNAALMNMMKKMYDEGDDQMKQTISKAMWEAQHKKDDDKKDSKKESL
jgi:calcyclin binding protein